MPKYVVQGIERQDWLQRFTIEADSREAAIQGVLDGDGERTNWLDDGPLESDFTDIHRWRVIEEDGEEIEDDKTGEKLGATTDLNAPSAFDSATEIAVPDEQLPPTEKPTWPRHWFNVETKQIITEMRPGDLTPSALSILGDRGRFFPCTKDGYVCVPAGMLLVLAETTHCLQDLLDNAEIDALNEPELEPRCERARQAIARATGN